MADLEGFEERYTASCLEAVEEAGGEITDVKITYPMDLTTQMLEYSGRLRQARDITAAGTR
jgi:hypothetical protein